MRRQLAPVIGLLTLSACGGGGGNSGGPPPPPPPPPGPAATVSLLASDDTVYPGSVITVQWTSANSAACTGSGDWSGVKATSGTVQLTVNSDLNLTLGCAGINGGASTSASIHIKMAGQISPAQTSSLAYSSTGLSSLQYSILPVSCAVLSYDSVNNLIYCATTAASSSYPSALISIDPVAGRVVASTALTSTASSLSVSHDGRYLYAAFPVAGATIQRYQIPGLNPDLSIPVAGPTDLSTNVSVSPLSSTTIAVLTTLGTVGPPIAGLQVFDGLTARPKNYQGTIYEGLAGAVWTPDGSELVVPDGPSSYGPGLGVQIFAVDATGISVTKTIVAGQIGSGRLYGNLFFDDLGHVFDLTGPVTLLGQMADYDQIFAATRAEFPAAGKGFSTTFDVFENTYVSSFSMTDFHLIDSIRINLPNGLSGPAGGALISWGADGLAWNEANNLVIAQGSFAQPDGALTPIQSIPVSGAGNLLSTAASSVSYQVYHLWANDLAVDSCGSAYASVSAASTYFGNSVLSFDPLSGAIKGVGVAGSEPRVLAVSDDCTTLYATLYKSNSVARLNLPGLTPAATIPLTQSPAPNPPTNTLPFASALSVAPGAPATVAITMNWHGSLCDGTDYGLGIFDGTTRRGLFIDPSPYGVDGYKGVLWGADVSTLYAEDWTGINLLTVDATGAHTPTLLVPWSSYSGDTFFYDLSRDLYLDPAKHRLLTQYGVAYDTVAAMVLPKLAFQPVSSNLSCGSISAVTSDRQTGKIFSASVDSFFNLVVTSFDSQTLKAIDHVTLSNTITTQIGGPVRLVRPANSSVVALVTELGYVVTLSGTMYSP